jgi:hypothetical protein
MWPASTFPTAHIRSMSKLLNMYELFLLALAAQWLFYRTCKGRKYELALSRMGSLSDLLMVLR